MDISNTISNLIEEKYSASWVSRVTDVIKNKVEEFRKRPIEKWFSSLFIDGVVWKIRRGNVKGEVSICGIGYRRGWVQGSCGILAFWAGGRVRLYGRRYGRNLCERGLSDPLCVIRDNLKAKSNNEKKERLFELRKEAKEFYKRVKEPLPEVAEKSKNSLIIYSRM
jgi:transposase-like protein